MELGFELRSFWKLKFFLPFTHLLLLAPTNNYFKPYGHLECEAVTEQWAENARKTSFAWESRMIFREEEVEGIADGPGDLKSLISGNSVASKEARNILVFYFMDNNCCYLLSTCYLLPHITSPSYK